MNRKEEDARATRTEDMETLEPELREVLGNFKASVDAWSEAMISRPREVKAPARRNWALITQWALGCVVLIGSISGGVYENHRQVAAAKAEEARIAAQQREQAAQKAREEEELMAKVDSDISRQVPSALEPLAALMSEDESTGN
jgi:hypothetical protein